MHTLAILPVKRFEGAKRRLQGELPRGSRRALAEAMFSDVLVALRRAKAVDEIVVVSADPGAQLIAGGHGAGTLDDNESGHNAAAGLGIQVALRSGARRALLVPGDCPMLDPGELDALLARPAGRRSVQIVPDRHGTGTNALLLRPPDALAPAFGEDSCQRHLAAASSQGTEAMVVGLPSLALDIDTPDDLAELQAILATRRGAAARTRGMLNQLVRSRA